jgi:hypothetical protein
MTRHDPLLTPTMAGWRMAGPGGFRWIAAEDAVESFGGSGLLWYAAAGFDDFVLRVEWRITRPEDNSGIFLRCPPLEDDPRPAIEQGYEVQIDDRGLDPETGQFGSALHLTGAIYRLAPATGRLSRPVGAWNDFEVTARGPVIVVRLNGTEVSRLEGASREPLGHVGLQNHHDASAVQFRRLGIMCL